MVAVPGPVPVAVSCCWEVTVDLSDADGSKFWVCLLVGVKGLLGCDKRPPPLVPLFATGLPG